MLRKLICYSLLSLLSFSFFSIVFHTIANAETGNAIKPPSLKTTLINTPVPIILTSSSPTPTTTLVTQSVITSPTDLGALFDKYSELYNIKDKEEELKKIAQCESGFHSNSNNNGLYLGMYQFAASSWISVRSTMGLDTNPDLRTNAEEAIKTASFMLSRGQENTWPNCK